MNVGAFMGPYGRIEEHRQRSESLSKLYGQLSDGLEFAEIVWH